MTVIADFYKQIIYDKKKNQKFGLIEIVFRGKFKSLPEVIRFKVGFPNFYLVWIWKNNTLHWFRKCVGEPDVFTLFENL